MKIRSVLVFSGHNQRAVIAFCRYATQEGISFDIVANGSMDSIYNSDYAAEVIAIRQKNKLDLKEIFHFCNLSKEKNKTNEILILPSTEFLNRVLLKHRAQLEKYNVYIGLCKEEIYSLISDKLSFSNLSRLYNIPIPQEFSEIPKTFPFVIKPKKYSKGFTNVFEKPILVFSEEDLENLKDFEDFSDYYFQEYIEGHSYYLLYHFSQNETVVAYSQENLIQQDEGGSIILARSSDIHEKPISNLFIELFQNIKFNGLVMVEVKFDGEKYVMIEANPRFWGPSQLILDSGMMLFDMFSLENKLKSEITNRKYKVGEYYFWSGGINSNLKNQKKTKFYNFSEFQFFWEYDLLMKNDIYLRKDTLTIYLNEVD